MTEVSTWGSFQTHADALIWKFPTRTEDNRHLRLVVAECRYSLASVAGSSQDAEGQRFALRCVLAYAAGLTGGVVMAP